MINDRVWIGAGAIIMGPISIGDDSVIGPSAVVIDDVAPGEVVAGVPVRTIPNTRDIYTRTANKTLASKI
jgi:serine acetyltransferase